jgi:hypothetical protein
MVAMLVAGLLLTFGYALLSMAIKSYHHISGHEDGELQMKRLSRQLQKDLTASSTSGIQIVSVPDPAGSAGDAVCFLSLQAGDDARGPACTDDGGNPFYQRNVLIYVARPLGDPCPGASDPDGYEDSCPHKVAIRKVIDSGDATEPLPAGDPANDGEEPLDNVAEYLTRPAGNLSVASMLAEPKVTSVEVIAVNILTMRVRLNPDSNALGEVQVTMRTFSEQGSRGTLQSGPTLLSGQDKTQSHVVSCFPRNRSS